MINPHNMHTVVYRTQQQYVYYKIVYFCKYMDAKHGCIMMMINTMNHSLWLAVNGNCVMMYYAVK